MTGEQKPGGLAQKIYDCPTTFDGDAIGTHLGLSMMVDQSTSTAEDQRRVVMSMCEDIARMIQAEPAEARIRELEAELEQYRSAARDHNDIWWKTVIGETHQPSGEGISVKHLHPLAVKPFYDQHKGTAIADIIAGLIFEASITRNRERFLVEHANDRATAAEAKVQELEALLERANATATRAINRADLVEVQSAHKVTAAEAKLARAVEGVERAKGDILHLVNAPYSDAEGTDEDWVGYIDQTLAALQQAGEVG